MKKVLLSLVAVLTLATANAQEENKGLQGTWFATAQIGYTSDGSASTTTFIPVVGTFIAPTTAVGLGVGVISAKPAVGKTNNTTVVEPLIRKYWPVAGSLYFYGQAAVPMLFNDASKTFGLTFTPGLDYVVNSWFTVEFSATLASFSITSPKVGDSTTNIGINPFAHSILGTSSQVGFKFLF